MPAINPNWTLEAPSNWLSTAFLGPCHPPCWLSGRISSWLVVATRHEWGNRWEVFCVVMLVFLCFWSLCIVTRYWWVWRHVIGTTQTWSQPSGWALHRNHCLPVQELSVNLSSWAVHRNCPSHCLPNGYLLTRLSGAQSKAGGVSLPAVRIFEPQQQTTLNVGNFIRPPLNPSWTHSEHDTIARLRVPRKRYF